MVDSVLTSIIHYVLQVRKLKLGGKRLGSILTPKRGQVLHRGVHNPWAWRPSLINCWLPWEEQVQAHQTPSPWPGQQYPHKRLEKGNPQSQWQWWPRQLEAARAMLCHFPDTLLALSSPQWHSGADQMNRAWPLSRGNAEAVSLGQAHRCWLHLETEFFWIFTCKKHSRRFFCGNACHHPLTHSTVEPSKQGGLSAAINCLGSPDHQAVPEPSDPHTPPAVCQVAWSGWCWGRGAGGPYVMTSLPVTSVPGAWPSPDPSVEALHWGSFGPRPHSTAVHRQLSQLSGELHTCEHGIYQVSCTVPAIAWRVKHVSCYPGPLSV